MDSQQTRKIRRWENRKLDVFVGTQFTVTTLTFMIDPLCNTSVVPLILIGKKAMLIFWRSFL